MLRIFAVLGLLIFNSSCSEPLIIKTEITKSKIDTTTYTTYSQGLLKYQNFNSESAINAIADIENAHFRAYNSGKSSDYYGTEWRKSAEHKMDQFGQSEYDKYCSELKTNPDSMHCTIYAVKALEIGMDSLWNKLESYHQQIYEDHEHAGWSMAYILVKHFNWEAHLIIDENSSEYEQCLKHFKKHKSYPVYKQPNIPLKSMLLLGDQDQKINELLNKNEFGWGFSYQGWHTWITRFNSLKECIWLGAPSQIYEKSNLPLFRETPFTEYTDYDSHIVVFPPSD